MRSSIPREKRETTETSFGCVSECRGTSRTSSKVSARSSRTRERRAVRLVLKTRRPAPRCSEVAGRAGSRVLVAMAKGRCVGDASASRAAAAHATRAAPRYITGRSPEAVAEFASAERTPPPRARRADSDRRDRPDCRVQWSSSTARPAFAIKPLQREHEQNRSSISPKNGMKSGMRSIGMTMYAIAPTTSSLSTIDTRRSVIKPPSSSQVLRQLLDVVHHRALGAGARRADAGALVRRRRRGDAAPAVRRTCRHQSFSPGPPGSLVSCAGDDAIVGRRRRRAGGGGVGRSRCAPCSRDRSPCSCRSRPRCSARSPRGS